MSIIFIIAACSIFFTLVIEGLLLFTQYKMKILSKFFGEHDFLIHSVIVMILWFLTTLIIVLLQFEPQPPIHNTLILTIFGWMLLGVGIILSSTASLQLGLKRSLAWNFFERNVPLMDSKLFHLLKNPEYLGFWVLLFGLTLATNSFYNLIITIEFILLMIPVQHIENMPIKRQNMDIR